VVTLGERVAKGTLNMDIDTCGAAGCFPEK